MYIVLENRPDRMGANLTWYIMQFMHAHFLNCFVHCHDLEFETDSFFIKSVRKFADIFNKNITKKIGTDDHGPRLYWIQLSQQDWPGNCMFVCNEIQCDLVSYFKEHLYKDFRAALDEQAAIYLRPEFQLPNKRIKTIGLHLRLDDVLERRDYEGCFCTEYYREKLNKGNIGINLDEEHNFGISRGVYIPGSGRPYNPYDCQAPIQEWRITPIIARVREKYPDHQVIIVASPQGTINLPYPCIRSNNMDQDLYYLCNCDVIICSRSLYCFSSVYLGNATEIYIPMWGHIAGAGLTSKFDKNTNLVYW